MLQVEVHFKMFSDFFEIFGYWQTWPLSKCEKVMKIGLFVLGFILSIILMGLSFLKVKNVEEFANTIFWFFSYCYLCSEVVVTWYHREKIKCLMSKMVGYFYENNEAVPFINNAVEKVKWITTLMMTGIIFLYCILAVINPSILTILPLPMWKPDFLDDDEVFEVYWLFQIFSIISLMGSIAALVFMCLLLLLINGYAKYLRSKLQMLVSTRDFSGYLELVDCIQVHRKLKE